MASPAGKLRCRQPSQLVQSRLTQENSRGQCKSKQSNKRRPPSPPAPGSRTAVALPLHGQGDMTRKVTRTTRQTKSSPHLLCQLQVAGEDVLAVLAQLHLLEEGDDLCGRERGGGERASSSRNQNISAAGASSEWQGRFRCKPQRASAAQLRLPAIRQRRAAVSTFSHSSSSVPQQHNPIHPPLLPHLLARRCPVENGGWNGAGGGAIKANARLRGNNSCRQQGVPVPQLRHRQARGPPRQRQGSTAQHSTAWLALYSLRRLTKGLEALECQM